ncbi:glycosyltransferase [Thermus thalpophilus]
MEDGNMRLLKVTTGLAQGGAENQLVQLAIRLRQRGWEVVVVSMLPPAAYADVLKEAGVYVHSLNMVRGCPDPRGVSKLAGIIRHFGPHVIHSHMVHANLLARITRLLAPVPVLISTVHNTLEIGRFFKNEASTHLAYRLTDRLADATTFVSQNSMRRFLQRKAVRPEKATYIPNGVDTQRFAPRVATRQVKRRELALEEGEFVWLAVGRLEEAKDYPTLLEAFSLLVNDLLVNEQRVTLLIVGQGSLEGVLRRLIAKHRLEDKVFLLGSRSDVPELMNMADAYVMSSAWEGMPMVLLEAHASGLPVV